MDREIDIPLREATAMLKAAGATEVCLFGSFVKNTDHGCRDIDIAVSGIPPEIFFAIMGDIGDLLQCPFDLIDLDDDA